MKLGICCNFTHPSTGGSEIVCKAIAEQMANTYGMDVTTFGYNVDEDFVHNKVKYKKCLKGNLFLQQIQDLDHLFIYSDSFWGFETILDNLDFMKPSLSIALLGMYAMRENSSLFGIFCDERKQFKVITHSSRDEDYKKCFENKISVTVIPNGVDVKRFNFFKPWKMYDVNEYMNSVDFKRKYEINTSKVIINVANYFYGKGQKHLLEIGNRLSGLRGDDFTIIQISNTVRYPHDKTFLTQTQNLFKQKSKFQYKFLRDIPREDVEAAFNVADIAIFTSLKEVAPITILESMAAKTLWISMDVGNVKELFGGVVICNGNHDKNGYKVFKDSVYDDYAYTAHEYLDSDGLLTASGLDGREMIEKFYNWDVICEQYYNVFID